MVDPRTNKETASYAEEAFVVDVQSFLHHLMVEKGFNRSQLAQAMGISRARVTQIFSDECKNFTVRLLARAIHALGERPEIVCAWHKNLQAECDQPQCEEEASTIEVVFCSHRWDMGVANDDECDVHAHLADASDRRISAALTDHARRSHSAQKVSAYA